MDQQNSTTPVKQKNYMAWLQVVGLGFVGLGGIQTILGTSGNFIPAIIGDLGFPIPSFTLWLTFYGFSMAFIQLVAGRIWLKVKTPVLLGVCYTIALLAMGIMGTYTQVWQWWISGIIVGVFGGCFFMIAKANILLNWFAKRSATALGTSTLISNVGAAILSPVHAVIIQAVGWRTGYFIIAGIGLLLGLPWILFIIRFKPEDKGVKAVGWEPNMGTITAGAEDANGTTEKGGLLSFAFFFIFIAAALTSLFGGFQNLWPNFAADWGYDNMIGATMISCTLLFGVMIPVMGWLIDKFGVARMCFIMIAVQLLSGFGLIFLHGNVLALYICVFLFADQAAIILLVLPIVLRRLFGPKNFTKIQSYTQIGLGLIGGFSAPVISSIAARFGSFTASCWFGIILAASIGLFFFLGFTFGKRLKWIDGSSPNIWASTSIAKKTE
jgi:MFS family permease